MGYFTCVCSHWIIFLSPVLENTYLTIFLYKTNPRYSVFRFKNYGRVSSVNRGVHALIAYHLLLYKTNSSFSITKPTYRQTKRCILHFSFITRNRTVFEDFYKIVNLF
ncbi:hypothetical protein Hanom_Chr15g01337901 [Helianthus anomalus]